MRLVRLGLVSSLALGLMALAPTAAHAAVQISRAELNGGQLRVEGTATPNANVVIDGGAATGPADSSGAFRIEKTGFASPTCVITVSDGSATSATASLAGCTPSSPPPPPP
ncbi:MAG: hypothetical protein E6G27_18610, partial [Actinobacteria bacterium]